MPIAAIISGRANFDPQKKLFAFYGEDTIISRWMAAAVFARQKKQLLALLWGWLVCASSLGGQQTWSVEIDGKSYPVEVRWSVKHSGQSYNNATSHFLDLSKSRVFDLEVVLRPVGEMPPPEAGLLWGFQYRHSGGALAPTQGEKRARGMRHFQRFQIVSSEKVVLILTPAVWKQTSESPLQLVVSGTPISLTFAPSEALLVAKPAELTVESIPEKTTPTVTVSPSEVETQTYAAANRETDSIQRIKALREFVDQYRATNPQSPLVQKALKEVPLGASLPKPTTDGKVTYVLDYAVQPVVDTTRSSEWQWELKSIGTARFALTLKPLTDTANVFVVVDTGKRAPYNRSYALRPTQKIQVQLLGQTPRDFTLRISGGSPPFLAYLTQKSVTRMRYLIPHTDTTWALSKDACTVCKDGEHTLEVYTGDFSTLLLRAEDSIYFARPRYWLWAIIAGIALALVILFQKSLVRGWKYYEYSRKLQDIERWERLIEKEAQQRKKERKQQV